MADVLA